MRIPAIDELDKAQTILIPSCIWMAAHHPNPFVVAVGKTVSVGGDCDTNAAIACGVVALSAGRESIPVEWLKARESVNV